METWKVVSVTRVNVKNHVRYIFNVPAGFARAIGEPRYLVVRGVEGGLVLEPLRVDGWVRCIVRRVRGGRCYAVVKLPKEVAPPPGWFLTVENGKVILRERPGDGVEARPLRGSKFVSIPRTVVEGWGWPKYVVVRGGDGGVVIEPLYVDGRVARLQWDGTQFSVILPTRVAADMGYPSRVAVGLVDGRLEVRLATFPAAPASPWWDEWRWLDELHRGGVFKCKLCGVRYASATQAALHVAREHGISISGKPSLTLRRLLKAGTLVKEVVLTEEVVVNALKHLLSKCKGRVVNIPLGSVVEAVYGVSGLRGRTLYEMLRRMVGRMIDGWRFERIVAGNLKGKRVRLQFVNTAVKEDIFELFKALTS